MPSAPRVAPTMQLRQAQQVSMARPLILLLFALGLFWVAGSLVTLVTAIIRLSRGGRVTDNLTGLEAVLLALRDRLHADHPALIGASHVRKTVWNNSMKAVDLADKLRRPIVVGLCAYGFASLLVPGGGGRRPPARRRGVADVGRRAVRDRRGQRRRRVPLAPAARAGSPPGLPSARLRGRAGPRLEQQRRRPVDALLLLRPETPPSRSRRPPRPSSAARRRAPPRRRPRRPAPARRPPPAARRAPRPRSSRAAAPRGTG